MARIGQQVTGKTQLDDKEDPIQRAIDRVHAFERGVGTESDLLERGKSELVKAEEALRQAEVNRREAANLGRKAEEHSARQRLAKEKKDELRKVADALERGQTALKTLNDTAPNAAKKQQAMDTIQQARTDVEKLRETEIARIEWAATMLEAVASDAQRSKRLSGKGWVRSRKSLL